MTYVCKDCFAHYCKIPYFCRICSNLIISEIHLSQMKNSLTSKDYENRFINLQKIFLLFYCERLDNEFFDHFFFKILQKIQNFLSEIYLKKDSKINKNKN